MLKLSNLDVIRRAASDQNEQSDSSTDQQPQSDLFQTGDSLPLGFAVPSLPALPTAATGAWLPSSNSITATSDATLGLVANVRPTLIETTDAAASTGSTYNLIVGQTSQGTLSAGTDHDWWRVSLVAGHTYTFAEIGTGVNRVGGNGNTYLRLRDGAGSQIAADDDSGPAASSSLTFTAATSGTYYLDAGSFNDSYSGQYGISASEGTRANFDEIMGAGAIDAGSTWGTRGSPVTITYGFRQSAASYTAPGHNISTFTQVSSQEMTAVQQILQLWSDVSGVTFTQVNPGGYTNNATILIGNYNDANDGAGAFAYYPGSTASTDQAGDLWLNLGGGVSTSSIPIGSYSFFAIMHELGHAQGLSHPGDYNAAPGQTITYANNAQFLQDTEQYSVMSYFGGSSTGENPGAFATGYTPMMFDIYELQQLYGANANTRSGDTTYGFGSNAGSIYIFPSPDSTDSVPRFCIWDGGGTDTLNCSGYTQNQIIDLEEGTFSNIGGGNANVSIALGVNIENAVGGSGNDTIIVDPNVIGTFTGGGGNDTFEGTMLGLSSDTFTDMNLGDRFYFTDASFGSFTFSVSGTTLTYGQAGSTRHLTINALAANTTFAATADANGGVDLAEVAGAGSLSINNVSITEGDSGTQLATFTVTRTGGTAPFSVNYATADGTATVADNDYVARSGTLNFGAGVNTQTFSVTVNGDTKVEPNETFSVNLSGATNGATISGGTGTGTIVNDDAEPVGSISINNLSITEGDSGTQLATFTVTRTGGTAPFSVNYATADGTATVTDNDYVARSGTLNFGAGVNTQTFSVTVNGDTKVEPNETFSVNLSGATNGATIDQQHVSATGTILNDDYVNRPPVANSDTYLFGAPLTINAANGVLHNDSDPDNDPLTAVLATGAVHGTVSLNSDGSFIYTPNPGYGGAGGDGFTYQASDGHGNLSSPTQVFILPTVLHNRPPFATDDSYFTSEDTPLTVSAPGVLGNDGDVTFAGITAVLASNPSHGSLLLNWDGSFTYTPNNGYVGGDSFTYWSSDGEFNSPSPAAVSISVTAPYVTAQVHANDLTYSSTASGFNHFIDFLNFEASYPDLIHAFGLNQQAMQSWYNANEPSERRIETFDGLDYIASYNDLINAFRSGGSMHTIQDLGATHFIANGLAEGRTTTFNGLDYIASHPDLIAAFGANNDAGALHYIENGRDEGRTTAFDGLDYIASYSDLIGAFGANEQAGAAHFITNGFSEGRSTTAFDGLSYIAQYTDLMNAFGANDDAGASHYITNGFSEGRSTSFDVAGYETAHPDLQGRFATNDQFLTAYINTYVTTGHFLT